MRVWRTHKEANRPFPKLSQDDVIDYMIMEALTAKDLHLQADQMKKNEAEDFKKDTKGFEERLATAT